MGTSRLSNWIEEGASYTSNKVEHFLRDIDGSRTQLAVAKLGIQINRFSIAISRSWPFFLLVLNWQWNFSLIFPKLMDSGTHC